MELQVVTKEEVEKRSWHAPSGNRAPASAAGLGPGDVIVALDGVDVESANRFVLTRVAKAAHREAAPDQCQQGVNGFSNAGVLLSTKM